MPDWNKELTGLQAYNWSTELAGLPSNKWERELGDLPAAGPPIITEPDKPEDQPGLLGTAGQAALAGLGAVGRGIGATVDVLRRSVVAAGWKIGELATGMDMGDVWDRAESSRGYLEILMPELFAKEQGLEKHPFLERLVPVAFDILNDPLTLLTFGGTTIAGKTAAKAGQLGVGWAKQAQLGQRALLTLRVPGGTKTLLHLPKAVGAIGAVGRKLKMSPVGRALFHRFSLRSIDPRVNQLVDASIAGSSDDVARVIGMRDDADAVLKHLSPEDDYLARLVAEHAGRPGKHHMDIVNQVAATRPDLVEQGMEFGRRIEAMLRFSDEHNLIGSVVGDGIGHRIARLDRMEKRDIDLLLKSHQDGLIEIGDEARQHFTKAVDLEGAARQSNKAAEVAQEAYELEMKSYAATLENQHRQLGDIATDLHRRGIDSVFLGDLEGARAQTLKLRIQMRRKAEKSLFKKGLHADDVKELRRARQSAERLRGTAPKHYREARGLIDDAEKLMQQRNDVLRTMENNSLRRPKWEYKDAWQPPRNYQKVRDDIVWMDVDELDNAWKTTDPSYYVGPAGTGPAARMGSYTTLADEITKGKYPKLNMPTVSFLPEGRIHFEDGRHRFAVLRDKGVKRIPVIAEKAQRANLSGELLASQAGSPEYHRLLREAASAKSAAAEARTQAADAWLAQDYMRETFVEPKVGVPYEPGMTKEQVAKIAKRLKKVQIRKLNLQDAQDAMPNMIPRLMSKESRKFLTKIGRSMRAKKLTESGLMWNDEIQGLYSRKFAERLMDGKQKYLRPLSLDEVGKLIENPLDDRIYQWHQFLEKKGGLYNAIDDVMGKAAPIDMSKMYNLSPHDTVNYMSRRMIESLRGKALFSELSKHPDLFSKAFKPGWFHIKRVSSRAHKVFGEAWIPPEMFEELRHVYTNMANPQAVKGVGAAWDWITKRIKWAVTRPFPAYHARNHLEDLIRMSMYSGCDPVNVQKYMFRLTGKKSIPMGSLGRMQPQKVYQLAEAYGALKGEVSSTVLEGAGGKLRKVTNFVDNLSQRPENARRVAMWVERINDGYSPMMAAKEVDRVLFDYMSTTPFERATVGKLIPFYSYMKNIVRLHAETILTRPGLITMQHRLLEGMKPGGKDEEIPEWVRGRFYMAWDKEPTGEEKMISAYGLPFQDVHELLDFSGGFKPWVKSFTWRLNPILKATVEAPQAWAEKRQRYTTKVFDVLPEEIKDMIGYRTYTDEGKTWAMMDPRYEWFFRNVLLRLYSTTKAASRDDATWAGNIVYLGLGLRTADFDPETEKLRKGLRDHEAELMKSARRGDAGALEVFFQKEQSELPEGTIKWYVDKKKDLLDELLERKDLLRGSE